MRHQARYWDGFKWTERVADHGIEGVDPVPGTEVVQTNDLTMVDADPDGRDGPTQLLGDTDVDDVAATGCRREPVSAGQAIARAKLGEREAVDDDAPRRGPDRRARSSSAAGWSWAVQSRCWSDRRCRGCRCAGHEWATPRPPPA